MANEVLFQSDYWFANTYSKRIETIQNFIEADDQRTLIIIDITVTNVREIMDVLNNEWSLPFVRLVLGNPDQPFGVFEYNTTSEHCKKTIYHVESLDKLTLTLIKRLKPILAIFT